MAYLCSAVLVVAVLIAYRIWLRSISKAKYEFLAESSPNMVWSAQPDGQLAYVNKRWYEYTGLTGTDYSQWINAVHKDDREGCIQKWRTAIQTSTGYTTECRLRNKAGQYHWFLIQMCVRKNQYGQPVEWVGTGTDIHAQRTEKDELEQAVRDKTQQLNDSYRFLHDIINTAYGACVVINHTGAILEWNTAAEKLFGWPHSEAIGRQLLETIIPPEFAKSHQDGMAYYLRTGEGPILNTIIETEAVDRAGRQFPVDLTITVINAGSAQPMFVGFVMDISERKEAEDKLRILEGRFRVMIDNVKDYAIFMLDKDGHVATWNTGAERIKGYAAGEIIGKHFSIFYPDNDARRNWPQEELELAKTNGRVEDEGWRVRKDGTMFWANVIISPIINNDGELDGFVKITRDDTARHNYQLLLRQASDDLSRSNDDLRQFAYAASHDLQEPLRVITGYLQLLSRRFSAVIDDAGRKYIDRSVAAATHMRNLIEDLLSYSRATNTSTPVRSINPREAIMTAIHSLEAAIVESNATVQVDDIPTSLEADNTQIIQLFQNLIGNGIKFRRNGIAPVVRVYSRRVDDETVFCVSDNGIGIPTEQIGRLFKIFQRLHTRDEYAGTGIGLAICKKIVEKNGGRIWIEPSPDQGSTFCFTLRPGKPNEQARGSSN